MPVCPIPDLKPIACSFNWNLFMATPLPSPFKKSASFISPCYRLVPDKFLLFECAASRMHTSCVQTTGYLSDYCFSTASDQSPYSDLWPMKSTKHFSLHHCCSLNTYIYFFLAGRKKKSQWRSSLKIIRAAHLTATLSLTRDGLTITSANNCTLQQ